MYYCITVFSGILYPVLVLETLMLFISPTVEISPLVIRGNPHAVLRNSTPLRCIWTPKESAWLERMVWIYPWNQGKDLDFEAYVTKLLACISLTPLCGKYRSVPPCLAIGPPVARLNEPANLLTYLPDYVNTNTEIPVPMPVHSLSFRVVGIHVKNPESSHCIKSPSRLTLYPLTTFRFG